MDFLFDPAIWAGLLTLVVLEIVLGIDNLVFIAILAKKLPEAERSKALYTGLGLAIVMRLGLLSVMSWLVGLTAPLFSIWGHAFSLRDLILLAGGVFLLFKATMELHERLEAHAPGEEKNAGHAGFWLVITQILILDAVFSLDSIITAVGMVDNLGVMMTAVVVAMVLMIIASRPLTEFVNAHPTVVVLCLSFLLMIGLSLVAEGLGFHIPKGYLYAAIGFSIMIEFFNQVAARSMKRNAEKVPLRERTLAAIVNLMERPAAKPSGEEAPAAAAEAPAFAQEERNMVEGVLTLAERTVKTVMTPRSGISWVNVKEPIEEILARIRRHPHSCYPVCDGALENVIGILKAKDLAGIDPTAEGIAELARRRRPAMVPETVNVIRLMRDFRQGLRSIVLVTDEFGVIQGLITTHDLLESIAGEFPDENEARFIEPLPTGGWTAKGGADLLLIEQTCGAQNLRDPDHDYATLAGLLLERFGRIPAAGDSIEIEGLLFEVAEAGPSRIERVTIKRTA